MLKLRIWEGEHGSFPRSYQLLKGCSTPGIKQARGRRNEDVAVCQSTLHFTGLAI